MSRNQIRQIQSELLELEREAQKLRTVIAQNENRQKEFTRIWEEAWKPWQAINHKLGDERETILERARKILERKKQEYQSRFFLIRIFQTPPSETLRNHLNEDERERLDTILAEMDKALKSCEETLRSNTEFMAELKNFEMKQHPPDPSRLPNLPQPLPPESGPGVRVHPEFMQIQGQGEYTAKINRLEGQIQQRQQNLQQLESKTQAQLEKARSCLGDSQKMRALAQEVLLPASSPECSLCQRVSHELKPQFLWPHQLGGLAMEDNLSWACPSCLREKEDLTLREFALNMRLDYLDLLRRLEEEGKTV